MPVQVQWVLDLLFYHPLLFLLFTTVCWSGRCNYSHVGWVPPPVGQKKRMVCSRPGVCLLFGRPLDSHLRESDSTANKACFALEVFKHYPETKLGILPKQHCHFPKCAHLLFLLILAQCVCREVRLLLNYLRSMPRALLLSP